MSPSVDMFGDGFTEYMQKHGHPDGTKVVLFNGPPGAGKDTAARLLIESGIRAEVEKFAKTVKEGCHGLFGITNSTGQIVAHDHFEPIKEKPNREFMGMSPREAYIWYSEEVMKPKFGQDVFGQMTAERMSSDGRLYFITDSGFIDEAQSIVDKFGVENVILVQLHREGCDFFNDSRSYVSLSHPGANFTVWNYGDEISFLNNLVKVLLDHTFLKEYLIMQ